MSSYILESNPILGFLIGEWNHALWKKICQRKMKRKKIDHDPVLVFIISLPRNKDWTVIQGLYNWDPPSSLCFMTFLFLGRKLRVTSSIWNYVSEAYVVAYVALYCGPIVNQSFLDKIGLVSPAQCLSIVRGTFQHYLQTNEFSAKIQMVVNIDGDHFEWRYKY